MRQTGTRIKLSLRMMESASSALLFSECLLLRVSASISSKPGLCCIVILWSELAASNQSSREQLARTESLVFPVSSAYDDAELSVIIVT